MAQVVQEGRTICNEEIEALVQALAQGVSYPQRSPIVRTPADYDLQFEEVTFPSLDGVSLEAWFIPCEGSAKLVIANHPLGFSRYGFPSHLEPWKSMNSATGNDFEVNFIPDYKILHDAGYNVLTYDLRNLGHSSAANGGLGSAGLFESRDVIGSLIYAKSRTELSRMMIGLFSRCLGCNATIFAMAKHPEYFRDVRCMIAVQPLSVRIIMERMLELHGVPAETIDDVERQIFLKTSRKLDDLSPVESAKSVAVPTLMYQVHDDLMTQPSDVQSIFDNVSAKEKQLFWIQGTTRRWDGYNYFQKNPDQVLDWFATHMR